MKKQQQQVNIYKQKLKSPLYPKKNQYNNRTILLIGKMGQGKSHLMHKLTQMLYHEDSQVFFFSQVDTDRQKYEEFKNVQYFDQDFLDNPQKLKELYEYCIKHKDRKYEYQGVYTQRGKYEQVLKLVDHEFPKGYSQFILVMDDIDIDQKQSAKIFKKLLRNYRHCGCSVLLSTQCVIIFKKLFRDLFNVNILYQGTSIDRLENIIYQMLPQGLTYEDFIKIYNDSTKKKFDFLLIDSFSDTIFQQNFDYQYIVEKQQNQN